MNVTSANAADDVILCPLDGRRSTKELIAKFFTVNIVTLAFYFHFIRRRDGTYLSWSPVIFFLAPLNLVVRYAVALFGIFIYFVFCAFSNKTKGARWRASWNLITPSLNRLFGRSEERDEYAPLPSVDDTELARTPTISEKISVGDMLGRIVVNGIFIAQCSGSIFLYSRRLRRGAVTMLDQRAFEAACGGLAICLLNLCLSLKVPVFADLVPFPAATTWLDSFALFWRDSARWSLRPFNIESGWHWIRLVKNLLITFVLLQLFYHDTNYFNFMSLIFSWHSSDLGSHSNLPSFVITFSSVFTFFLACIAIRQFYTEGRDKSPNYLSRNPWLLWIAYPIGGALGSVLGVCVSYLMFGSFYVLQMQWGLYYVVAFYELSTLSHAPVNSTCPLLWSDPMANWVWGLA